jgi:hypothetical protein
MRLKEDMNQYRGLAMKAVVSSKVPAIPMSILDFKLCLSFTAKGTKQLQFSALII